MKLSHTRASARLTVLVLFAALPASLAGCGGSAQSATTGATINVLFGCPLLPYGL